MDCPLFAGGDSPHRPDLLERRLLSCSILRVLCIPAALAGGAAFADPGYYVVTAYSNPGVRTLDFRYWTVASRGSALAKWPEVGLGWNVNSRWYSAVIASWITASDMPTTLSSWNWQNDLLLTQGEVPFDLAIHTMVSAPRHVGEGHTLEFGPAVQTDIGRTQLNANVFAEKGYGGFSQQPTQLKYQWQVRHRWKPGLHFGAQGFGELGEWDRWAPAGRQSHRAGPALFGSIQTGQGEIGWQAAYLYGKTYRQRGNMFTARVAYHF
ncbi:hypothetical protein PMI14_04016 [Acidovorax sp. CF316]|nr:hypothetical protein PMI14_04016 [Acidovorax sp. CF316]